MIKYFCDCCNQEADKLHTFSYLCHVDSFINQSGRGFHVSNGERISAKYEDRHLCIICYNKVLVKSVAELHKLNVVIVDQVTAQ